MMRWLRRFVFGFRAVTRARQQQAELDAELRDLTENIIENKIASGMIREAAAREARVELGNPAATREWVQDIGWQSHVHAFERDVRYAFRMIGRSPGLATAAIVTLGLGIGANAAVFSVMDAVWFRAVPYQVSDRFVMVWNSGAGANRVLPSTADFLTWQQRSELFELLVGIPSETVEVLADGANLDLNVARVDPALFPALGERPLAGRLLTRGDQAPDAPQVALISAAFWNERYGRSPDALGQTIRIRSLGGVEAVTIVGVLPERFSRLISSPLVRPVGDLAASGPGRRPLRVFGILRPGIALEQAQAVLRSSGSHALWEPLVVSVRDSLVGADVGRVLTALFGAVALVLVMACVNVANLMFARMSTREREIAIRSGLGASRGGLVRQLLVESAVIAALGAGLGLLLARVARAAVVAIVPASVRGIETVAIDTRVLGFVMLLAVLCALACGLWPALRLAGTRADTLLSGRRGTATTSAAAGTSLLTAEIGVALIVIIASAVLLRGFARLVRVDPGFDPRGVVTFRAVVPQARPSGLSNAGPYERSPEYRRVAEDVLTELRRPALGGLSAGAIDGLPLRNLGATYTMRIVGSAAQPADPWVQFHRVTPGYLEAMRIQLRQGRPFSDGDREGAPDVALVNEIAARSFWPGEDPVGKQVFLGGRGPITVVGVVSAVRYAALDQEPMPEVYRPWRQDPAGLTFVVRTRDRALLRMLRAPNATVAGRPVTDVQTLDEHVMRSIDVPRFRATLFAIMGVCVLIIATIGVWGVTAHTVTRRTREIGIRMALGAVPVQVQRLIIRQASVAVVVGTGTGLLAAFWATTALERFLFETSARDPVAFTVSAVVLGAVALAAAYLPARRTSRIDPAITLRLD